MTKIPFILGVSKAVGNVNTIIAPALEGKVFVT